MTRATCRRAAKPHRCGRCDSMVRVGEFYLAHVCSPDHDDLGNTSWWREAECTSCAVAHGRAHLLDDRCVVA